MKKLEPSKGFRSTPISTNKSKSNEQKSRRTTKPRDKFEPNFGPTYKRTKLALTTQEANDMTNLLFLLLHQLSISTLTFRFQVHSFYCLQTLLDWLK
jgi:hypothetical protein